MGLDTTHGCWHGAYSAFMRWRKKLAEVAGLPPLMLHEGFYEPPPQETGSLSSLWIAQHIAGPGLPLKWDMAGPLTALLYHSDCEGELEAAVCGPLADRLEELLPMLPDEDSGGHIGNWREKTRTFIDGLRLAAAAGEPVGFH